MLNYSSINPPVSYDYRHKQNSVQHKSDSYFHLFDPRIFYSLSNHCNFPLEFPVVLFHNVVKHNSITFPVITE